MVGQAFRLPPSYMKVKELFQAGKLGEAIQGLAAELRDNPADGQRRTFLFELLCFAGDYERAEKQLDILGQAGPNAEMGVLLYRGALAAERTRQNLFQKKEYPETAAPAGNGPVTGVLNGSPFQSIADADPRIGPKLEVFAAGGYLWLPFAHIASIEIAPPHKLRDLLWVPAKVQTGPGFEDKDLGQVLLPAISPLSWKHPDDQVRLGRMTEWQEEDGEEIPFGQKMLLVDDQEIPLLELRSLQISPSADVPDQHASA